MGKMEDKDNNMRTRGTDGRSLSDLPLYGKCIRKLVIIRICWYILNFQHLDIKLTVCLVYLFVFVCFLFLFFLFCLCVVVVVVFLGGLWFCFGHFSWFLRICVDFLLGFSVISTSKQWVKKSSLTEIRRAKIVILHRKGHCC